METGHGLTTPAEALDIGFRQPMPANLEADRFAAAQLRDSGLRDVRLLEATPVCDNQRRPRSTTARPRFG